MTLTIFAGTFNPIHTAHLIIAQTVKEELELGKVLFIPAYCPPHRETGDIDPVHRLNMVQLAIQDNPDYSLSDIEYRKNQRSYSLLTVKALLEENPHIKSKVNFIIGADAFKLIDSWYQAEKLAKLVKFIVVSRPDTEDSFIKFIKLKNIDYINVKTPLLDISSSYIRKKIKVGKSIKYLVPKEVEEYIVQHDLYR